MGPGITISSAVFLLTSLVAFLSGANSFQISPQREPLLSRALKQPLVQHPHQFQQPSCSSSRLNAAADEKNSADGLIVKNRKDVSYDEKTGKIVDANDDECEEDEFCVVDKDSGKLVRLTLVEKERIFLDSLQSYYVNGRQILNDSEFDLLKEDLSWNGSPVANLNRKEAKYLSAMQAFSKGDPIISDEEFDVLKKELKEEGSKFAVTKEPLCYIDTGICTVTLQEDKFRSNLLYLPAGAIIFILWLGVGFEIIEPFARINPLVLITLGFPLTFVAQKITEDYIFTDSKVAYGPCPICEVEQRVYFGGILGVEGYGDLAEIKCKKCKDVYRVQKDSLRASSLPKD